MDERKKKTGRVAALVIILVAFFQLAWPSVYPAIVGLNEFPSVEYLQVIWLLGPTGLTLLTILAGGILLVWVEYAGR